jgi:hypothetical protein
MIELLDAESTLLDCENRHNPYYMPYLLSLSPLNMNGKLLKTYKRPVGCHYFGQEQAK